MREKTVAPIIVVRTIKLEQGMKKEVTEQNVGSDVIIAILVVNFFIFPPL